MEPEMKQSPNRSGSSLDADEPDRLSALPDCLLHNIMSFMKARQLVQTCVLSKRWSHLWHSTPCLDIDLNEFKADTSSMPNCHVSIRDKNWEDFAVSLMLHHNIAQLDSFRLSIPAFMAPLFGSEIAASWLRRAMKYCAPSHGIQLAASSNSWHLKSLSLCNIFLNDRFGKHVSSLCHSLEDLELESCICYFHTLNSHSLKNLLLKNCSCGGLYDITSHTLKNLVIDGGSNLPGFDPLLITAPVVTYLCLVEVSSFYAGITLNDMVSLHKASIHLQGYKESIIGNHLSQDQLDVICSLSNVTCLELSNLGPMVLTSEESATFNQFKSLMCLFLDNCDLSDGSQTLEIFLQNSVNLEKLTLRLCKLSNDSNRRKTGGQNKTSYYNHNSLGVQRTNLKLTEMIYKDDDDVRQLVEILLHISLNLPNNRFKLSKVD